MNTGRLALVAALLAATLSGETAWAHGPGARGGVYVGPPAAHWGGTHYRPYPYYARGYYGGGYYGGGFYGGYYGSGIYGTVVVPPVYAPYYYPPAVVTVPSTPPVYIEQSPPTAQAQDNWWYWCPDSQAYYPYVKECAGIWQRVPPQPPAPAQQSTRP